MRLDKAQVIVVVVVWALISTFIAYVVGELAAHSATRTTVGIVRAQVATGCVRTQVQRAYDRIDEAYDIPGERDRPSLRRYLGIIDCKATYNDGNPSGAAVTLSESASQCFTRLVADGYFLDAPPTTDATQLRQLCRAKR